MAEQGLPEFISSVIPEPRRIGDPGRRREGDDLAPYFTLEVGPPGEERPLQEDITQYIESVEFESALDMADLMKIKVHNPGLLQAGTDKSDVTAPPDWGAHRAFQPGNEMNLLIGYGSAPPRFVGRVILAKHSPNFSSGDEVPSLEVKGYDKSFMLMNVSGNVQGGADSRLRLREPRPTEDSDDQGQGFVGSRHSDVIHAIAEMHSMDTDIDETSRAEDFSWKKGMKHYEIVRTLANINDRDFWVDFNHRSRRWVLHWKEPLREPRPEFIFVYGRGDASTLLSFQPEYGLREAINEATILIFDRERQQWISAIEIEDFEATDPRFQAGGGAQSRAQSSARGRQRGRQNAESRRAEMEINEALENASAFRLAAAGVAIDVLPPGERFADAEAAARFLRRWFLERRDSFIIGKGEVIGVETLLRRQVHRLEGIGVRLSGEYLFTSVRHKFSSDGLYKCEFIANKMLVA